VRINRLGDIYVLRIETAFAFKCISTNITCSMEDQLDPAQQKTADRIFRHEDKKIGKRIGCYRNFQITFLIIGALFYVLSIVDMPAVLGFQEEMPSTFK
jgi:hypothetical protein